MEGRRPPRAILNMDQDPAIESLREALRVSPNNLPLRRHLAEEFLRRQRWADAETELREALKLAPRDANLKTALARCFHSQGKASQAMVVIEELIAQREASAETHLLHARLLFKQGEFRRAVSAYRDAVEMEPNLADPALAEQLGVERWEDSSDEEDGEPQFAHVDLSHEPLDVEVERPKVTFEDVGGMEKVKEEIRLKIIHPLTHPEIYEAYGKKIGGGILLYGPPGCGKTHIARATAGEINAGFISVGLHDVLDMYIGKSEKNLHELFDKARANTPCVLFFDEVDALGASRTDMRTSGGRQIINQFLSELDGIDGDNEGLLVLAATNAPWHLDSAFRRPGRFDRIIFVPPPDEPARAQIMDIMLAGKPLEKMDTKQLARQCDGLSGADLKAVVDIAIETKLRAAMNAGIPTPLTTKDLLHAAKSVKASTKEWFSTARNYALFSNQSGAYDDILDYLKLR